MTNFIRLLIFSFFLSVWTAASYAADLIEVYNQATISDPVFQSARAAFLSATQLNPQARALLLPNLGFQLSSSFERSHIKTSFINIPAFTGKNDFFSTQYSLLLNQPIIDIAQWYNVGVSSAQVKQAAAEYIFAAQDLLLRVSTAYFDVLQAQDTLRFTEAEKQATKRQLDQSTQRYEVGFEAITSVYDAQASYDAIIAREIAAKNDVVNRKEVLRQITGVYYDKLALLKTNFPLVNPQPADVELWVSKAGKQNYLIQAGRYAAIAAKRNIHEQFAGHFPTINFQGTYNKVNSSNSEIGSPGNFYNAAGALQLNLPIYQGGLVLSQTRQAKYDYEKALADLETTYREVTVNTRQTFNDIINGISKIAADKQAIKSRASSLESTEAAVKIGTRTMVDLLQAQQQLFLAQSILSRDQYAYIISTLTIKQTSGTLNACDLKNINKWLTYHPHYDTYQYYEFPDSNTYLKGAPETPTPGELKSDINKPTLPSSISPINVEENKPVTNQLKQIEPQQPIPHLPPYNPLQINQLQKKELKSIALKTTHKNSKDQHINNKSDFYTLQILASPQYSDLKNLTGKFSLSKQTHIQKIKKNNQDWYELFYGNYPTEKAAENAINKLPLRLQKTHPWVRHIASNDSLKKSIQ